MRPLRDRLQSSLGSSYTIQRELGGGGMARVFVATEAALRRQVVVKVLPPELTGVVSIERFEREIYLSAGLQHPHIVPVLAAGEVDGIPYYTMPLVEGESLRARLSHGALPLHEAVACLRDICKALAYAHERRVVHRDIKPENVLLSGGSATVTDFGIAKAIAAARTSEQPTSPAPVTPSAAPPRTQPVSVTQPGITPGTPAYMAPEQVTGDPALDHRADIYALGCLAYELLTGVGPFQRPTREQVLAAQLTDTPRDVRDLLPDVPEGLARLIMQCLAKDASARPASVTDILRALDGLANDGGGPQGVHMAAAPLRRALLVYAVATVLFVSASWAAVVAVGLPRWVLPAASILMATGLPLVLLIGSVRGVARRLPWRRASGIGAAAVVAFVLFVAIWMGVRASGLGPFGSLLAAGKLQERDVVILTDFQASNTDSALGRVMSDVVRAGLSESAVLTLASPARITDALARMQRPSSTRLDLPLARELAIREGIKAVVDGHLAGIPGGHILTLRLLTADSGIVLATFSRPAEGPKGLIDAADEVSRDLRERAGESLRRVNASPPLAYATTASLDAARRFSEAYRANSQRDLARSIALARAAVAIDPTFATAWRLLGNSMANAAYPVASVDSAYARAFALRERVSMRERLAIESFYYRSSAGAPMRDRAKAEEVLRRQIEDGDSSSAANSLGIVYESRRDWRRADSLFAIASRAGSTSAFAATNRIITQALVGGYAAGERQRVEAYQRFPVAAPRARQSHVLLYHSGDITRLERRLDSLAAGDYPQLRAWALLVKSDLALRGGRLGDWRRLRALSRAADEKRGVVNPPHADSSAASMADVVLLGDSVGAVARLEATLAASLRSGPPTIPPDVFLHFAGTFAMAGRPDRARDVLARYERSADTSMQRRLLPLRNWAAGEVSLAEGRHGRAINAFRRGDSLPDGPANSCAICLPLDLGRVFDRAGQADSAITMYEAFLHTPSPSRQMAILDGIWLAWVHRRLGALYELRGDTARANEHNREFVNLWRDADSALQPRVRAVRALIARMPAVATRETR